jgi:cytochrome c oxidase subunit 2
MHARAFAMWMLLAAATPAGAAGGGAGFAAAAPLQDALHTYGIQAGHIGRLWNFTLGLCTLVFAAIVAACLLALWRAPRADATTAPDLSSLARPERRIHRALGWAVGISTLGLLALLAADVVTSRALARMPLRGAVNIELVGHQWWWEARYKDEDVSRQFSTANELHIPVGRPVVVTLKSSDVIHSLWVPNLHGKRDLIPGRTAILRLQADQPGTYRGQCAEFCGLEHAMMALLVKAEPDAQYEAWAAQQRLPAPEPSSALARRGREVFLGTSCVMCHTISGTVANAVLGPDLTHLASRQTIAAGMLPNEPGHLAGWISDPQALKPGVNMPANTLPPDDLQALLAYLETLK